MLTKKDIKRGDILRHKKTKEIVKVRVVNELPLQDFKAYGSDVVLRISKYEKL